MIDAAPTTLAPAAVATSPVSLVDPPGLMVGAPPAPLAPRGGGALPSSRGRPAGRDHVLDEQHAIVRLEGKPAPQRQRATHALREECAYAECARDLMADDETAQCRRQHRRGLQVRRA